MKKAPFFVALLLATFVAILISCGKSGAPDCSDEAVRSLVMSISTNEVKDQLLSQAIMTELRMAPRLAGNPTYDEWNKIKDTDENIKTVVDAVDEQIKSIEMTLVGIRTNEKNDEIKKCRCGGNISIANGSDEKSLSIDYTAQYTDDGELFVEVNGLR